MNVDEGPVLLCASCLAEWARLDALWALVEAWHDGHPQALQRLMALRYN